jgi:hypothetical protein
MPFAGHRDRPICSLLKKKRRVPNKSPGTPYHAYLLLVSHRWKKEEQKVPKEPEETGT